MIKSIYEDFMDSETNSLRHLPPAQRFQIMAYLSVMWTTIFCLGTGAWLYYGHLIIGHIAVAFGLVITGMTFYSARTVRTYRDYPLPDRTARYDDVWGA